MSEFHHNTLYYDRENAAKKLGRSIREVEAMIRSNKLQTVFVGGKRLIPAQAVNDLLAARSSKPVEKRERAEKQVVDSSDIAYYYTPSQVAEILGMDLFAVNRLVRQGKLRAVSIDKHRWMPAKDVKLFVRKQYGPGRLVRAPEPRRIRKSEKQKPKEIRIKPGRASPR